MRGRSLRVGTVLVVSVVLGCSPAPTPSPSITPPPTPADFVPWPDIVWAMADLPAPPLAAASERVVAITATPDSFVAVGYREMNDVRDGVVWRSPDGVEWDAIDDERFAGVEFVDVAPAPDGFDAFGVEDRGDRQFATLFQSDDGNTWQRLPPLTSAADMFPGAIVGGANGVLATGWDADGEPVVWHSPDRRSFRRVTLAGPASSGLIDPQAAGAGFVALGTSLRPPTLLHSTDAEAWTASMIDQRADIEATTLAVGRWGLVAQGVAPPTCEDACPDTYIAWWSDDGDGWGAIQVKDSPLVDGVSLIVPAGEHGLLAVTGADAWSSPDGWAWRPLPSPGDGSVSIDDAVARGDVIVAVGAENAEDGSSAARILVARQAN